MLFDHCIIVIDNDNFVLEIYNIITKKCHNKIGSNNKKIYKNNELSLVWYGSIMFNSWSDLLKYYNIDSDINISGLYTSYTNKSKNHKFKEFFHINFKKEGLYTEYYYNNQLKIKTNYINDKLFGTYEKYNIYGGLICNVNYNNNMLNGNYFKFHYISIYNYNTIYTNYIDDKLNGEYYSNNINSLKHFIYVDNKKHGSFYIFYKRYEHDGRYRLFGEYKDDKLLNVKIYTDIYSELKIKQEIIIDVNNTYIIKKYIYESDDSYRIINVNIESDIDEAEINLYLAKLCFIYFL